MSSQEESDRSSQEQKVRPSARQHREVESAHDGEDGSSESDVQGDGGGASLPRRQIIGAHPDDESSQVQEVHVDTGAAPDVLSQGKEVPPSARPLVDLFVVVELIFVAGWSIVFVAGWSIVAIANRLKTVMSSEETGHSTEDQGGSGQEQEEEARSSAQREGGVESNDDDDVYQLDSDSPGSLLRSGSLADQESYAVLVPSSDNETMYVSKKFTGDGVKKVAEIGDAILILTSSGKVQRWYWDDLDYYCGLEMMDEGQDADYSEMRDEGDLMSHEWRCPRRTFTTFACGREHIVAISTKGDVFSWSSIEVLSRGFGEAGMLGHGPKLTQLARPKKVTVKGNVKFKQVACGDMFTLLLSEEGRVYWMGHLQGRSQFTPELVHSLEGKVVTNIDAGNLHAAAVTEDGAVYTWGCGTYGRLGHGDERDCAQPTHVKLAGVNVKQVGCGERHTALLTKNGQVFCFGDYEVGQLGLKKCEKQLFPIHLVFFDSKQIAKLCTRASLSSTILLSSQGEVYEMNFRETKAFSSLRGKRVVDCISSVPAMVLVDFTSLPQDDLLPRSYLFRYALNDEVFSDVRFVVENRTIHAHRVVLAKSCAYFSTMFTCGMKETGRDQIITIHKVGYDVFYCLLDYLYTGTLNPTSQDEEDSVLDTVKLEILADMYGLPNLQFLCRECVRSNISDRTAPYVLRKAAKSKRQKMKEIALTYIRGNFEKVSQTQGMLELQPLLWQEIVKELRLV